MVIEKEKTLVRFKKNLYRYCTICGQQVYYDQDFIYTKHKQGESFAHEKCLKRWLK